MRFTIPSDGIYLVNASVRLDTTEEHIQFGIFVNDEKKGATYAEGCNQVNFSQVINANENDVVGTYITGNHGTSNHSIDVSFIAANVKEEIIDYYKEINKCNKFKALLYA